MPTQTLPYADTGYFSKLICDYLDKKDALNPFYNRFPEIENFGDQIAEKRKSFSSETRKVLVASLEQQYSGITDKNTVLKNLVLLNNQNTFTVTTGHQLNLFTGPLYFLYKIISAIKLSRQLKEKYPDGDFVPVYWMATEDHDFDEINHFNFEGTKVQWNRPDVQDNDGGAVGRLDNSGLDAVHERICKAFGDTQNGQHLCQLFEDAYLKHETLAEATRYLAHRLFGEEGLVIVDGDDQDLKRLFAPFVGDELFDQTSGKEVNGQAEKLMEAGYGVQVTARDINLFYLTDNLRERIIKRDGKFFVTKMKMSSQKMNFGVR